MRSGVAICLVALYGCVLQHASDQRVLGENTLDSPGTATIEMDKSFVCAKRFRGRNGTRVKMLGVRGWRCRRRRLRRKRWFVQLDIRIAFAAKTSAER